MCCSPAGRSGILKLKMNWKWLFAIICIMRCCSSFMPLKLPCQKFLLQSHASVGGSAQSTQGERLQKLLSRAGITSRRNAERMIEEGRVTIDGYVVREFGVKVNTKVNRVHVDGKLVVLPSPQDTFWLMLHRPRSPPLSSPAAHLPPSPVHTENQASAYDEVDPRMREIKEFIPQADQLKLRVVGGLGAWTGLVLLTNDYSWIHPLTHRSSAIVKQYEVVVRGLPSRGVLESLLHTRHLPVNAWGIMGHNTHYHDGDSSASFPGRTRACRLDEVSVVEYNKKDQLAVLSVVVVETVPKQVQRIIELAGLDVINVKRLSFGSLHLGHLKKGQWRELTGREVEDIKGPAAGSVYHQHSRLGAE